MRDLPSDKCRDALVKVDRFLTTKGVCSAEVLVFVLLDKLTYLHGSFWGGVRVRQPGFEGLGQAVCDNLLDFQAAGGKEG